MRNKILVDTNVLLDACMNERPNWEYANILLDEIAYGNVEAFIAATSLKDVYYVLSKYAGESAASSFVRAAPDAFTILAIDSAICRIAASSNEPDFEDGLIRACAESANVDFIVSRDEKAFARSRIKRLSAEEYVNLFCPIEEVSLKASSVGDAL